MTAEAIIRENTRFDRSGKPVEIIVPYETFIDFVETYGLDLTEEEKDAIHEAKADRKAGRTDRFISSEEIKKEFGLT